MNNPIVNFFKKIAGTFFLPTRTFEALIDEPPASALKFAMICYAFYIAIKFLIFIVWPNEVYGFIHNWNSTFTIGSEIFGGNDLSSSQYPVIFVFFVILIGVILVLSILVTHLLVIMGSGFMKPDEYRTPPSLRKTAVVVLNCSAPLFLLGTIPILGFFIGFYWFNLTIHSAISAYYGKIWVKGKYFTRHYSCIPVGTRLFLLLAMFGTFTWFAAEFIFYRLVLI
jgi:hypothetical protein